MIDNPNLHFDGITVPPVVQRLAAGRAVAIVWVNEIGGVTYRLGDGEEYVKYGPPHWEFDAEPEFERLRWVGAYVPAPRPIDHGQDEIGHRWLRTVGIPATSAVLGGWHRRPAEVVPELGRALRRFHDRLPVADCHWEYSIAGRLARKIETAPDERTDWPELDLVVCHGDACNPNFLLDGSGQCIGYLDLGKLGVGDRWADLAPALQSLGWNFPGTWEQAFLDAYGIDPDPPKQEFYTWLWNAR